MVTAPETKTTARLPIKDEWGFFGIRFESIGGYGAHIAGRMLAEAGVVYMGFNGSNFSSYGSEKKGSPVKAYVRFCDSDQEVRTSAPIEEPHVIAVFHEALIHTQPVAAGLREDGTIIVNTRKSPEEIRELLGLEYGTVATVDAITIAVEEKTRVNTAMLGALCRVVPFIDPEAVKAVIRDTFGKKYPHTVPGNLRTFDRGYESVRMMTITPRPGFVREPYRRPDPPYGYLNAPIGGLILSAGNSVVKDLSASRQGYLPAFDREKCIDCAQCDIVCPDYCFVWEKGTDKKGRPAMVLKGIDYQYCKGCLKCVEACPTGALQEKLEEDGWAKAHRVPRFALPA
ncbi:MAG: 2-oxoacid:acceptor oxidoreductase family protein [Bacillota bacterium]|nr:MAG: ferredoxin [Bacillota bacterium]